MNPQTIREFVEFVRNSVSKDCCLFQLTINSESYEVTVTLRDGTDLKKSGVSMRNLKGEWIKDTPNWCDE